ncbi:hypothetical protein DFQ28_001820, partial [Apophysomyces sp. BC1034]
MQMKSLKKEGYTLVGYCRKSPGQEIDGDRIRLLQQMVNRLSDRSLVEKVFVSCCSSASDLLLERDLKNGKVIIEALEGVEGDTQDLVHYLRRVEDKVCIVAIDFAGFSTNSADVRNFF